MSAFLLLMKEVNHMNHKNIPVIMKELREKMNYLPSELAGLLGVEESTVLDWESGAVEPTISEGLLLSKLYNIDLNDMFLECDEMAMVPHAAVAAFQQATRQNRYINRWYI